jgi:hypothetical protein
LVNNKRKERGRNKSKIDIEMKWGEAKKRKPLQGKKFEESCPGPGGKISCRGSYCRTALGNSIAFTGWIRRIEFGALNRAVS